MGRLVRVDEHGGINEAFDYSALLSIRYAVNPNNAGKSFAETVGNTRILDKSLIWNAFTHLSYDWIRDVVIISTGKTGFIGGITFAYSCDERKISANDYWIHVPFRADTLDPHKSFDVFGLSAAVFPFEGAASGFYTDPLTEEFVQAYNFRYLRNPATMHNRFGLGYNVYSDPTFGYGLDKIILHSPFKPYPTNLGDDCDINGPKYDLSGTFQSASGTVGKSWVDTVPFNYGGYFPPSEPYLWGVPIVTLNTVTLGDAVFYIDNGYFWGAFEDKSYAGGMSLPIQTPMALTPVGRDRLCMVWWPSSTNGNGAGQLLCAILRFHRTKRRFNVENIDTVPTEFPYNSQLHQGWFTYDYRRQLLIALEQDGEDYKFVRYTFSEFCHPISPRRILAPTPIGAIHSGRKTTYELATYSDIAPQRTNGVILQYTPDSLSPKTFSEKPTTISTDVNGIARIVVGLYSGTEGELFNIDATVSSFSVVVSANITGNGPLGQTYNGKAYGADTMIISASQSFNVSGFVSASLSSSTLYGGAVILAAKPSLTTDSVGAGSPRQLIYPSGLLPSPLVYELNPHQWTNMADEALIRPLYATTMTLTKTVNVSFVGDITDLEIREIWIGGGSRASMPYSFFSLLYDYYVNVPDFHNVGYIQWKPRDINNHTYNVLLTNLTVGGSNEIVLDTLSRRGFIHDTVELTLRIINQVD